MTAGKVSALVYICAAGLSAYVRSTTDNGNPLLRPDFARIQFKVNQATAAGMTNSQGGVTISSGSDPLGAIRASLNSWNNVATSAARFAPLEITSTANNPEDGQHVITFLDTPAIRSAVGGALAITISMFTPSGRLPIPTSSSTRIKPFRPLLLRTRLIYSR